MRKFMGVALVALSGLLLALPAHAVTFNIVSTQWSPQSGVNPDTGEQANVYGSGYNAITPPGSGWFISPNGIGSISPPAVSGGSLTNQYRSPFQGTGADSTESYFSIGGGSAGQGNSTSSLYLTLTTGLYATAANILWGSIDSYNVIEFFKDGATLGAINGQSVYQFLINNFGSTAQDGNSGSNSELIALVAFGGLEGGFNQLKFSSSQPAFEFGLSRNSITFAPVPLPAALPLFATALGGMGLASWLRKRKASAAA